MKNICQFFGVAESHQLRWAHRVNTQHVLESCAADPSIMMLEGDILLNEHNVPMMLSPLSVNGQHTCSPLSYETWLRTAVAHQKGVKIDLMTPAALIPVLTLVAEIGVEIPIILHADIFNLLAETQPQENFEPEMFVQLAQRMAPFATLSLGWSLSKTQDNDGKMESILIEQMTELLLTKLGGVSYTIEFRAGYTPNWEKGAAFIFEPIDNIERPSFGENVIDGIALFRKDLFVTA